MYTYYIYIKINLKLTLYIYVCVRVCVHFFSTIISLNSPNPEQSHFFEVLKMHVPYYFLYKKCILRRSQKVPL